MLRFFDGLTYASVVGGALMMLALLLLLVAVIGHGAWPAVKRFGFGFLTSTQWSAHPPEVEGVPPPPQEFGARTAITGTLLTSIIAMLIGFPVSLGTAIFLTKIAPKMRMVLPAIRNGKLGFQRIAVRPIVIVVSFLVELLAAIPSIAYGLWGFFVLVPYMQKHVQPFIGHTLGTWPVIGDYFKNWGAGTNILTAGVILSIMVTPIITAIIRDVLTAAPPELEQGAYGLGATWWQSTRLVLGFSKMGILGAGILGFARAIGETMAVTMVIGNSPDADPSILSPGQSIASLLANQYKNADTEGEMHALVYAAFVLLVITTLINGFARLLIMRVAAKSGGKR